MAERRMFSRRVVKSDAFTEMPLSAQALYYHLGMEADDDGFVSNPKQVMRAIGANDDDLRLLIAKKFVIVFPNGLVLIKHWRIHNSIQKDRYTPSTYQKERESIMVRDNGAYTLKNEGRSLKEIAVSMLYTQVSKGKVSKGKNIKRRSKAELERLAVDFEEIWSLYPRKVGKKACRNWWARHAPSAEVVRKMAETIEKYKKTDQWQRGYIPHPQTFFNQGRWEDEVETPKQLPAETKSYGN